MIRESGTRNFFWHSSRLWGRLFAVALLIFPLPIAPATLRVDESAAEPCTLVDAINAANLNAATGNCPAGDPGPDTIELGNQFLNAKSRIKRRTFRAAWTVLLPLAKQIGLDPIHFGAIMVLNLVIGLTTPPLGVCLFVSSGIAGISLEKISRAMIPFLIAAIVVLLLVTYIPSLSMWIPQLYLQR